MPVHVQMNGFVTKLTLRAGVIVKEVLTIVALVLVANTSCQAAWPERSIRFIVPVAAGGGVDIMSRILADRLSQQLSQRVVVENVSGGGGSIAVRTVPNPTPTDTPSCWRLRATPLCRRPITRPPMTPSPTSLRSHWWWSFRSSS